MGMPSRRRTPLLCAEPLLRIIAPVEECSPKDDAEDELRSRFLHLTEVELPAVARERRWGIRFDHCFKRICLDHAFGGPWYSSIRRPAVRYLQGDSLARAVHCAEELVEGDAVLLAERNRASLRWRGKLPKQTESSL